MQLYFAPRTISVATVITLRETGLPHELVRVDFASAEQTRPAYHRINPKGRVPALVTDDGILTETGALLEYLAALAPQAKLVPDDPVVAARMREAMYYLASTMHVNHAHRMRGARWADRQDSRDDMAAKVPQTMTASAVYIEDHVLNGPFVLGERFSIADPYLYVICSWLEGDGVDVSGFARINAFRAAMEARASVRSVIADGYL